MSTTVSAYPHVGVFPYACTCKFDGQITKTTPEEDYVIYELDGALRIQDVSEKVREAVRDSFSLGIRGYIAWGAGTVSLLDALHTAAVITFHPQIDFYSDTFRYSLQRTFFMGFVTICFFIYIASYYRSNELQFYNSNRVQQAQFMRQLATINTVDFLSCAENYRYFHDGELLKLMILAKNQVLLFQHDQLTTEIDKLFINEKLSKRMLVHHADFWISITQEWKDKKEVKDIFGKIEAKVQELLPKKEP